MFAKCESTEILTEPAQKSYIISEKISINNLLQVIRDPLILKESETFKSRTQESILEKSGKKTDTYFTKIVKRDEYTTYLLLINTYSTKKTYFMYYIITERENVEKAGYVKYFPNTPSILLDQQNFTGKIQMHDIKQNIRSQSRFLNGQEQKQTNTTTARVADNCTSSTTIIPHNCGDTGNHTPGTACDDGGYYSYYEIKITTTCPFVSGYDNSSPLPNEFINTSDGLGGGGPNADIEIVAFELLYLDANQKTWWNNPANIADKTEFINYLNQNPTDEAKQIASQMIAQMYGGRSATKFDVKASLYSPMNIITSTIDTTTTEGKKFNEIYTALLNAPEFKSLFIDIFKDSKRDNVKFEINDHVNEDNDPTKKEVNATASQDPVTKNITIKISKQILIAGTTMSQTKIENAKTILHECIHAYLFVKANYPSTGVDFVKILDSMYPTPDEQHDFMFEHMVPTMQKVLAQIRDAVTTAPKRANLEIYSFYASSTASKSLLFNWQAFYGYLSLRGLQKTSCFIKDFPYPSDNYSLYKQYIDGASNELDR